MIYIYDVKRNEYHPIKQYRKMIKGKKKIVISDKEAPHHVLFVCNYKKNIDIYIDYMEAKRYVDYVTCPVCKTRTGELGDSVHGSFTCKIFCSKCNNQIALNGLVIYMIRQSAMEQLDDMNLDPEELAVDVLLSHTELKRTLKESETQDIDMEQFESKAEEGHI